MNNLIKNFINKFLVISLIFSLIIILSILKNIFFKNIEINFLYPYFLTLLSGPITLFEIFHLFFYYQPIFIYGLFKNEELNF